MARPPLWNRPLRWLRASLAPLSVAVWATSPALRAQELEVIAGERFFVAEGEARAGSSDAAKEGAIADARARLLRYRRTWVQNEVKQEARERIVGTRGDYTETTTARTTQKAEGELRGSVVVEASTEREGGQFVGHARVRCPEKTLLPHLRLQALERNERAGAAAFLQLAVEYGADEARLAEQTLRLGWGRTGDARVAFALAQALARERRDGEALHFAGEALRQAPGDDPLRARVESLVREVKGRVPTVEELARRVMETGRQHGAAKAGAATVTRTEPGRVELAWSLDLGPGERIVKSWVDHELTLYWRTASEGGGLEGPGERRWTFAWPPADRAAARATCVLWRLPAGATVLGTMAPLENRSWPLAGPAGEGERLQLADALHALAAEATAVAVIDMPAR